MNRFNFLTVLFLAIISFGTLSSNIYGDELFDRQAQALGMYNNCLTAKSGFDTLVTSYRTDISYYRDLVSNLEEGELKTTLNSKLDQAESIVDSADATITASWTYTVSLGSDEYDESFNIEFTYEERVDFAIDAKLHYNSYCLDVEEATEQISSTTVSGSAWDLLDEVATALCE